MQDRASVHELSCMPATQYVGAPRATAHGKGGRAERDSRHDPWMHMADEGIRALREEAARRERAFGPDLPVPITLTTTQVQSLADEALRRGEEIARLQKLAQHLSELEAGAEDVHAHERIARLEAALR